MEDFIMKESMLANFIFFKITNKNLICNHFLLKKKHKLFTDCLIASDSTQQTSYEPCQMDDFIMKESMLANFIFFKITNKNLICHHFVIFYILHKLFPDCLIASDSTQQTSYEPCKSNHKEVLSKYFHELHRIMEKYDLLNNPNSIYNMDETNINAEHKPPKVANTKAKSKTNAITSQRSDTTTLIACGNAAGRALRLLHLQGQTAYSTIPRWCSSRLKDVHDGIRLEQWRSLQGLSCQSLPASKSSWRICDVAVWWTCLPPFHPHHWICPGKPDCPICSPSAHLSCAPIASLRLTAPS